MFDLPVGQGPVHITLLMGPKLARPVPAEVTEALLSAQITATAGERSGFQIAFDLTKNGIISRRLLPEGFVKFVSTPAPAWRDSSYGGMVWLNARGVWNLPRDAFAFRGAGGQDTYVVPSRDLVVVRMGHYRGAQERRAAQATNKALELLVSAIEPRSRG